ncbi:MAG TPA: ABC transporter permease [Clostridiaceae bacterium]|nr:ABC transporter permease [Clostridiaceae bacterium]
MKNRYLILVLVLLSAVSVFIGVKDISLAGILEGNDEALVIMALSRIPRLLSVIIAGVSMSISGLIMQGITRNKFVSPTTAATMDSAKLGILVSLILFTGAGTLTKMSVAFIFALLGTFLFLSILKRIRVKNVILVPLIGIMLGGLIDSVTTFFAYRFDMIQNINSWMQGSFSMVTKGRYELLYLTVPMVLAAYLYANKFTIAGMGEDFAKNLGLNYNLVVNAGLVLVSLISGAVLVTVGSIPFLGLIIPNIVSMYNGDNLKRNIGTTALLGAVFLLFCDVLGRLIVYPYEVSISLTVGVLGSVIFLFLIIKGVGK